MLHLGAMLELVCILLHTDILNIIMENIFFSWMKDQFTQKYDLKVWILKKDIM